MKGTILMFAILLQLICCSQEQVKPVHVNPIQVRKPKQVAKRDSTLKLEFTKGVGSIFNDSKGNYWFGSHQEGVCLYDGKNFSYFKSNDGLADNQVRSIQEDKKGIIWISTAKGISSFNRGELISHKLSIDESSKNTWHKTEDDLWFNGGNSEGVFRYDGHNLDYLAFPKPQIVNPDNIYFVTGISAGKNDMIWFASYAGIFGYDGNEFIIINDETLRLGNETEPGNETARLHIRSILEDSKGRLWIGNNGIGVVLKESDTTINFSEQLNLIHPTSSRGGDKSQPGTLEHVFAIEEDGAGNIWFGDRDTGVWRYDGHTMINYTKEQGLTNDFVLTIYRDNKDELWLGLADGNVFKFNGQTFDKQF